ncbi:MAG: NAD-binding protein [Armatimonadetes bacterium]|nr:NAD-binding protein [Armatimonadota bacterium]
MFVIVAGGGDVGYYLTKALAQQGYEVALLEKDRRRAAHLGHELSDIVIHGDACEVRVLNSAGAKRADVVVAATGDDEDNLIISQLAKDYFKVKRILARVRDPRHERLFKRLGILETICSTRYIINLLEQEVEVGEVLPIGALQRGQIEIIEAEITPDSPVVGKAVEEVKLPEGSLIAALVRDGQPLPCSQMVMSPGDTVILVATEEHRKALIKLFAA